MSLRHIATALPVLAALASPAHAQAPAPLSAFPSAAPGASVPLAAHRAVYRLTMDTSRGSTARAARGTMLYEVSDVCDAWATRQRLAMTVTNSDGQDIDMVSDYATLESKDGLSMSFRMRQTTETAVTEQVEGNARLDSPGGPGVIKYTGAEPREVDIPAGTSFPMSHTVAILQGAAEGKRFLSLPLFDGTSDKGPQDSSVAIAGWNRGGDAQAAYPALRGLPHGRVRIAFFDREPGSKDKVLGSPDYEVGMKYYANGVADDLQMDFTDFVMNGKLTEFAVLEPRC